MCHGFLRQRISPFCSFVENRASFFLRSDFPSLRTPEHEERPWPWAVIASIIFQHFPAFSNIFSTIFQHFPTLSIVFHHFPWFSTIFQRSNSDASFGESLPPQWALSRYYSPRIWWNHSTVMVSILALSCCALVFQTCLWRRLGPRWGSTGWCWTGALVAVDWKTFSFFIGQFQWI